MREEDARAERDFMREKMKEIEEKTRKAKEKLKKGVIGLYQNNVPISIIALSLNMTEQKVSEVIAKNQ